MIVRTSGNIKDINYANFLIRKKFVDLICMGRKFISDPTYLINYTKVKEKKIIIPNQYKRCF